MPKSRLDSWKSIAEYLERSSRTVQRWHTYHGLPVHHFGGCKGSVFAYEDEIDRWLTGLAEETRRARVGEDEQLEERKSSSFALTAQAVEMWETRSEGNLNAIAGLYRKSIDQYPANGAAFIGLANAMIAGALQGVMDNSVAYPCALESLRWTAQLDADELEVKCCSAWLNMVHERKWRQARSKFEEVLSKQPENSSALSGLALLQIAEGDPSGASEFAWKAWRQNALVGSLGALVCWCHYLAGDIEQALGLVEQVRSSGGSGVTIGTVESMALIQAGPDAVRLSRIEAIAWDFPQNQLLQGVLGYGYALSMQADKAWEIFHGLERMNAQKQRNNAYGIALICMGLNKGQEAIRWLEASFGEGSLWSLGFRSDPILQSLRGDLRHESLLRKIGTPAGDRALNALSFELLARAK